MKKVISVFTIIRPLNCAIIFLSALVGFFLSSAESQLTMPAYLAAISAALIGAGANIINDVFDLEIDLINRPDRPIPKGELFVTQAISYYIVINIISIFIAFFINLTAFIFAFVSIVIVYLYSRKLKRKALIGNITVSFMTAMVFVYAGIAAGKIIYSTIPAVFAFMSNMIREIVKDMEDIEGDYKYNAISFPQKYGFRSANILILILTITLIISTAIPFVLELYAIEYFVVMCCSTNILLIVFLKNQLKSENKTHYRKNANLLKAAMIFGLLAIYLGK